MSCEGTMYRVAETSQIVGSVLKKNIIQCLVLVMDNAWFLFIRNANDQNLDVGVVKTPMHLLKFP